MLPSPEMVNAPSSVNVQLALSPQVPLAMICPETGATALNFVTAASVASVTLAASVASVVSAAPVASVAAVVAMVVSVGVVSAAVAAKQPSLWVCSTTSRRPQIK